MSAARWLLALLCACSSRPVLDVAPADAGSECRACREPCGKADSDKAARFCSLECDYICEAEEKRR